MYENLGPKDEKILQLLCQDFNQNEISIKSRCSRSSIEKRIQNLKIRFNVKNISGLIYKYTTELNEPLTKHCR